MFLVLKWGFFLSTWVFFVFLFFLEILCFFQNFLIHICTNCFIVHAHGSLSVVCFIVVFGNLVLLHRILKFLFGCKTPSLKFVEFYSLKKGKSVPRIWAHLLGSPLFWDFSPLAPSAVASLNINSASSANVNVISLWILFKDFVSIL